MKELPKLVLNRDYVMSTNKGHVIEFKKGKAINVPAMVFKDAIAIGAQPADGSDPDVIDNDKKAAPPADPVERNPIIKKAILELVDANEREDFTAAGTPTVDAVSKAVGFKVSSKEIAGVWQEINDDKAAQ